MGTAVSFKITSIFYSESNAITFIFSPKCKVEIQKNSRFILLLVRLKVLFVHISRNSETLF